MILGLALFLMTLLLLGFGYKLFIMKRSIQEIENQFNFIIRNDTNLLITLSSNDRNLKQLCSSMNNNLKTLRRLKISYEQGNQDLQHSITNISHDLRTPLTAIRGYLDLMEPNNLSEKQKLYLSYIHTKVLDLTDLTEQLFFFFKKQDHPSFINKKEICLNAFLETMLCSFYDLLKTNEIEPVIQITDKPIIRNLDEFTLKRIFENILSNAVKYSEKELSVILHEDGWIEFSNKTSSLDKITAEKIFNRFYTVENARKNGGIGLSIAKDLIELNGGQLFSSYEKGVLSIFIQF